MAYRKICNLEEITKAWNEEHGGQKYYASDKSNDAGFISAKSQLKDRLHTPAVKAME